MPGKGQVLTTWQPECGQEQRRLRTTRPQGHASTQCDPYEQANLKEREASLVTEEARPLRTRYRELEKGDRVPQARSRLCGSTQTQRSAACLKAVFLSFVKEGMGGLQRGQPGRVGKALPGIDKGRCRQPRGAGQGWLQQAFSTQQLLSLGTRSESSSRKWSWFLWFPGTWSFLALRAHCNLLSQ